MSLLKPPWKNLWNHCRWIYFWRVLAIWTHSATVHSASTASATSPASSSCIVAEKPQSPKRRQTGTGGTGERSSHRKSILQRSRTINYVPENCNSPPDHQDNLIHLSNGRSHLNSSAGFHHDQVSGFGFGYFLHLMYIQPKGTSISDVWY